MGVAFLVGILMMNAVRRHPEHRPAFQSKCAANRQDVLDPLGRLVSTVREQAVISHADSQAAGNPPKQSGQHQGLPAEHKQSNDGADVKCAHEKNGDWIDRLAECLVALENAHSSATPRSEKSLASENRTGCTTSVIAQHRVRDCK